MLCLSFSSELQAQTSPYSLYIIKKGDDVSTVLKRHSLSPLFGKDKWVSKVLKLNRLNLSSTKKLEPGDVLVLPVKGYHFTETKYQDEVKFLESSWEKIQLQKYLSPKRHNLTVSSKFFRRTYEFQKESVEIKQGIELALEYKKREIQFKNDYSFNPQVGLSVYSQSNAEFSDNKELVAEFTPSTKTFAKVEIENRAQKISFSPYIEIESFSVLNRDSDDNYIVDRENILWSGIEVNKYLDINDDTYRVSLSYLQGINSDEKFTKIQGLARMYMKQHYVFDLYANQYTYKINTDTDITDMGLTLGYRF